MRDTLDSEKALNVYKKERRWDSVQYQQLVVAMQGLKIPRLLLDLLLMTTSIRASLTKHLKSSSLTK